MTLLQHPVEELLSWRGDEFRYNGASEADLKRRLAAWLHRSQTFEMEAVIRPGTHSMWRAPQK
jgi:hypothetical protein